MDWAILTRHGNEADRRRKVPKELYLGSVWIDGTERSGTEWRGMEWSGTEHNATQISFHCLDML
ncbi:hypothetical protein MTR_1g106045 [Medicago truncatula]|uniref:Uncharacterized protein n=1 Tax=Medicago truncatula TaxID=3880 RepID=A0A072VPR3_MEDTR|nr:hypothetical protein MTR_1g106045 [Medicago truncatula]